MAKRVKLRRLMRRPLMRRLRRATRAQREALAMGLEGHKRDVIDKMKSRGYQLEAIVSENVGVFTRGRAIGSVELVDSDKSSQKAS